MLVRRTVASGGDASTIPPAAELPDGACLRRLREFPPAVGLGFGSYGEASPSVHTLVRTLAVEVAAREWREMGARSEAEARGIVTSQLYRQLSLAVHGGHMRVIHARCGYVGLAHDAAVTEAGRQAAPEAARAAAWPGPRPLGVGRAGGGG